MDAITMRNVTVKERLRIPMVIHTKEATSVEKDREMALIVLKNPASMSENTPEERRMVKGRFGIQVSSCVFFFTGYLYVSYTHVDFDAN